MAKDRGRLGGVGWKSVAALGLALVFACALATWGWVEGRPAWHLAEAERGLEAGEWAEAEAWLDLPEASRFERTRARARLLRARVAVESGRPEAAVEPLRTVDPEGPLGGEAAFWRGRALLAVGNSPLAIAWFQRSLAKRPGHPDTLRWLASAAYELGDRRTVLQALEELTRVLPDDARAWRTLGLLRLEEPDGGEREFEQARQDYERSLALDRAQPRVRLELAGVLVKQGRLDEAERQLRICRGGVPGSAWAELQARVEWTRGDRARCLEVVEAGLEAAPGQGQGEGHAGLLARRGLLAQADGKLDEALDWFDRAVAAEPYQSEWIYMRAIAHRALGQVDEARRDAARADELKQTVVALSDTNAEAASRPDDPDVRIQAGRLCERLGKTALAASWYRAALACDPASTAARAALAALSPAR